MDSTGSILMTTITRIRTYLDDPSLDAKYDNDFLVRQIIEPEMVNVITSLNATREEPILCKFLLDSLITNNERIELPPNVGVIARIAKLNTDGTVANDVARRDETDPRGPGWHLDGRDLNIRPDWDESGTDDGSSYNVWYIPSGDFNPHYSAGGGTLATLNTVTVDTTPDVGGVDKRQSAYIGGVLRVWSTDDSIVEERVITSYDVSAGTVGVRTDFSSDLTNGSVRYEIVPEFMGHLWQAVALASCMNLGIARNITEKQMVYLKEQFGLALQTATRLASTKVSDKSIAPENSVLYTILERIRWGLPDKIEGEMSNDYIMRSVVNPKLAEVMSLVNGRSDSPIIISQDITFTAAQEHYVLPPCVSKLLRISLVNSTTGLITSEVRQRDENDPNGNGWMVQGNRLSVRPIPSTASNTYGDTTTSGGLTGYKIWFIPSGDFMPHYANDGTINNAGKTELKLTSGGLFSRQLGIVDKRSNSYVGAQIRVFESDGSISERVITAHDPTAESSQGTITVSEAFTSANTTVVSYEIVAPWMHTIMSSVVTRSILELVTLKAQLPESDLAILSESAKSSLTSAIAMVREKNAQEIVPNKDSVLHMILEKTKTIIGDVARELDYSDDYIFRHGIVPEYSRVMSRIQNTSSDYIISKHNFTLVKDQQYYQLPASIGEIVRIVSMYDDGRIKKEMLPRSQYSDRGPNWSLEGSRLAIRPYPTGVDTDTYEIWYIPTHDAKPHYAEDGLLAVSGKTITLSKTSGGWASQILGDIDRRDQIYVGSTVRVLEAAGIIEERVITAHSPEAETVTVDLQFNDEESVGKDIIYEIVPTHYGAVTEAVAQGAAMNLLVGARKVTKAQHVMLLSNFKSAMKTAMDHFTFMQNRIPKKYDRDTVDNKNRHGGLYGIR